jgi:hypothetical protein
VFDPDVTVKAFPKAILRNVIPAGAPAFNMRQMALFPRDILPAVLAPAMVTLKDLSAERFHLLACFLYAFGFGENHAKLMMLFYKQI